MITVQNFLSDFDKFNDHVRQLDFTELVNPRDQIAYPDVTNDIPEWVRTEIFDKLSSLHGRHIHEDIMFLRLTNVNTTVPPHQAHTDTVHGTHAFFLYMQDGPGGTAFVRHKETGMDSDPKTLEEFQAWERDTNDYDAWEIIKMSHMGKNKGVIYNAEDMHRAEPVLGFGEGVEDGRIVLVLFYTPR